MKDCALYKEMDAGGIFISHGVWELKVRRLLSSIFYDFRGSFTIASFKKSCCARISQYEDWQRQYQNVYQVTQACLQQMAFTSDILFGYMLLICALARQKGYHPRSMKMMAALFKEWERKALETAIQCLSFICSAWYTKPNNIREQMMVYSASSQWHFRAASYNIKWLILLPGEQMDIRYPNGI